MKWKNENKMGMYQLAVGIWSWDKRKQKCAPIQSFKCWKWNGNHKRGWKRTRKLDSCGINIEKAFTGRDIYLSLQKFNFVDHFFLNSLPRSITCFLVYAWFFSFTPLYLFLKFSIFLSSISVKILMHFDRYQFVPFGTD